MPAASARIEIKAMKDEGYDAETAAAITAASATIGPIIPPSLPMVIYGVSADVSIGAPFLAGVIPGLLMAGALMLMVPLHRGASATCRAIRSPGLGGVWMAFRRGVLGADGAGDPVRRHDERLFHADRGRRRRDAVYALVLGLFVYRDFDAADAAQAHRRDGRDHRRCAVAW